MEIIKKIIDAIKKIVVSICKLVTYPLMENGQFSLGRVLLVLTFALALWKWIHNVDIKATHETFLQFVLAYVLVGKGIGAAKDIAAKWTDAKKINDNGGGQ